MKRQAYLLAVFLLWLTPLANAQPTAKTADPLKRGLKETDFPRTKKLADNVYSYEALRAGDPGSFMTTNSLIVVTTDGVLVADGQGNVKQSQELVDAVKKLTSQPIKYVVICSDHGDHTGGNTAFPSTATFIAHPTSKKTLEDQSKAPNRPANAAPVVIPSETVADRKTLKMGNTEIQLMFLGRAHTGGDLHVYLPKDKILFMSEAYLHRVFPAMRSAYPSEWIDVVKKAESMDVRTFIPGHGFVDDPATLKTELSVYRRAMEAVVAEATRLHKAKVPVEEAIKQANFGEYGSWTLATGQGPVAIRKVYEQLDGKLKQ